MKRPQLVSKGTIQRIRQAAEQAWNNRDLQQCVELLERACRLDPANPGLLMQLARMHGLRYDYDAAERCFEKAIRVAPGKAEALAHAAQQCRDFYNTSLAERYLERAAAEKDATAEILVKLAEVYERLRRVEEAASLVERALRSNPAYPPALLVRARLAQRAGQFTEAETILRSSFEKAEPEVRTRAWYELGAVLDRQGRYDEAMSAFLQAKALLRPEAAPHLAQLKKVRNHLAQMREQISAELLRRWFDFGRELQPPRRLALLGGHPRSGTTLLEQVLDSHPDIASAEETNNFTDYAYAPLQRRRPIATPMVQLLDSAPKDLLLAARAGYFRASDLCLAKPLGNRLLIDKNPSQTFVIPAFVRVFPEIKFLVALRDPRDVCLSCFMQPFVPLQQGSSAYLSLETTAEEYVSLMTMWRTLAPLIPNPSLEVRYEDMVEDLEAVARKVLAFLGVAWDERVLGFDEHARQKVVRSPTYADVTQKVFKRARGRWRNYQKYLEPCLPKLEPFVKAFGYE